jgi:hypothetical protein
VNKLLLLSSLLYFLQRETSAQCSVNALPLGGATTFCVGGSVTIQANALGVSPFTYLWSNGATTPSIDVNTTGNYSVTITDANNCVSTSSAIPVVVRPQPTIYSLKNLGGTICEFEFDGDPTLFGVGITDSDVGVTYTLYKDNVAIEGASGTGIALHFSAKHDPGTYTVKAMNQYGCQSTMGGEAIFSYFNSPQVFDFTGHGQYCASEITKTPITLTESQSNVKYQLVRNDYAVPYAYPWNIDNEFWIQGTSSPIVWEVGATASYKVLAYDPTTTCYRTMNGQIDVSPIPTSSVFSLSGGGTMCASGGLGKSINTSTSTIGIKYQLRRNGVDYRAPLNGTGTSLTWDNIFDDGHYEVWSYSSLETIDCGYAGVSGFGVDISVAKIIASNKTICSKQHTGINISSNFTGAVFNYVVKSTTPNITGYSSGSGDFINQHLVNNSTSTGNVVYTISIVNDCPLAAPIDVTVTVEPLPSATITPASSTTFCSGGSVILNANTGTSLTYQWIKDGTNITGATASSYTATVAGTYSVRVTNSSTTCSTTSTPTVVTVNSLPPATITAGSSTTFCSGGSVILNANTGANLTYQWIKDGTNITGATASSYTATVAGTYSVRVTNSSTTCSTTSTPTVVTVNSLPPATITAASSTTFCSGGSVVLNTNTGTNLTYQWIKDGTNITGATASSYTATVTGTYSVRVTNSSTTCSITSASTVVTVNPLPSATITPASSTTFCSGNSVILNANTGTNLTYQWIKDGINITGASLASYSATLAGSYTVRVTNSNTTCWVVSTAVIVTIKPKPSVTNTNKTICSGDPVNLSLTSDISGATFSWVVQSKSSTISGTTVGATGTTNLINHILTNSSSTAAGSVVYRITPTANSCLGNYKDITITVNANVSKPTITILGSLCDQYVTLRANASGATSYQWSTSNTSQTVNMLSSGNYTVTAYYPNGCSRISDPITITIPTCSDPCEQYANSTNGRVPDPPCLEELQKAELIIEETTAYPNPADDEITVHLPAPAEYDIPVKMYSQFGQTIHLVTIQKGEVKIELTTKDLTGGIYLIQLQLRDQKSFNRKVLVAHNR